MTKGYILELIEYYSLSKLKLGENVKRSFAQ